jgi:hypothetical protein
MATIVRIGGVEYRRHVRGGGLVAPTAFVEPTVY